MALLLVLLVLSGVVILLVGSIAASLQVKDFGSAFGAALAMAVVGWLLATPMTMAEIALIQTITGAAEAPDPISGLWLYATYLHAGFVFVENVVLFLIVALLMPGITIRGALGPLLVAVLLTVIDVFVPNALVRAGLTF